MSKPFKLLWIDDEEDNIEILRDGAIQWTSERSNNEYHLQIIEKRTYDDDVLEIAKDPHTNLIITDLNLLDGKFGSDFITTIRDNEIYKDVLLYSSDSTLLMKKILQLDGIYYYPFMDIFELQGKIHSVIWQCLVREEYAMIRNQI